MLNISQAELLELANKWEPEASSSVPVYRRATCVVCGDEMYEMWHAWLDDGGFRKEVHICGDCGRKWDDGAESPEASAWHPLTWRERLRILPILHDIWFAATYWTMVRDRMRCPSCTAIGTWKMHGSLLERWIWGDIHVRRWLCKWCGHYIGPRGRTVAYLDQHSKAWALPEPPTPRQSTPAEAFRKVMGKSWPWVG